LVADRERLGLNLKPHDSIARRLIEDWLTSTKKCRGFGPCILSYRRPAGR
jgi:hypothetical protein